MGTRRDRMQIIEDILRAAEDPRGALKTHLVYGSNLNFMRLENYLDFLLEKEMLEFTNEGSKYFITGKGREFLKMAQVTRGFLKE